MEGIRSILLTILLGFFGIFFCSCTKGNDDSKRNPYNLALTQTTKEYNQQVIENPLMEMVDLEQAINSLFLDIRYATSNNFTGQIIYASPRAFARNPVALALERVQDSLEFYKLALKIYDAYRPYAATLKFYEVYPDTNFVANPKYGSRHNRGCAIDLTLVERLSGKEIPMPTGYDDFSEMAFPDYTALPDTIIANRTFLFNIMSHFGFTHYPTEWWHFDFTGWENYPLMDLTFEQLTGHE